MIIKHATASTFVFARTDGDWRLGLILHPLLGRLMVPGGHVETDETAPEAARREVLEETGLAVRFLPAPGPGLPDPFPGTEHLVSRPWWIIQQPIAGDNHVAESHVHVDHLFVAVADSTRTVREPQHPFGWHRAGDLAGLTMFEDTRSLAMALFAEIGDLASADGDPAPLGLAGRRIGQV